MDDSDLLEIRDLCLEALSEKNDRNIMSDDEDVLFESLPLEQRLDELISRGSHFPSPEISDLLKLKCQVHLERKDYRTAAAALIHSQGLLFRHQVLVEYNKRLRRREEERARSQTVQQQESERDLFSSSLDEDEDDHDEDRAEQLLRNSMAFQDVSSKAPQTAEEQLRTLATSLPSDWRVVQITCKPTLACRFRLPSEQTKSEDQNIGWKNRNPPLYLTVIHCGENFRSTVVEVPALHNADRPTVMTEFDDIVSEHRLIYKRTESFKKAAYELARDELDDRMRNLIHSLEDKYLGYAKVLLLGRVADQARREKIAAATEKLLKKMKVPPGSAEWDRQYCLLSATLDGASLLEPEQVAYACAQFTNKKPLIKELLGTVAEFGANNPRALEVSRGPVALVLDGEMQMLPWESLNVFSRQPTSRVPSLFFLSALYQYHEQSKSSVTRYGVRNDKIFYVLNPNKDLEKTQARLEKQFKSSLGDGVVGRWPSQKQIQTVLSGEDAFLYCGHGSRLETIRSQEIERLRVRAVPLLFGCSSGRLERMGRAFDPIGGAHSYLIATAPALLGFLWSVTDQDVDQWTVKLLEHWLGAGGKGESDSPQRDFVRAVSEQKSSFTRLLNGAALVVYGLPAFMGQ